MATTLLLIAGGGFAGAAARYALAGVVYARLGDAFPWGTLAVNLTGSFVLGALLPYLAVDGPATPVGALLVVGAIGAFTTFSTFAYEAIMLLQRRDRARALAYIAASVGGGLVSLLAGIAVAGLLL